MSLTPPSPANDYAIPLGQAATRAFLQGVFSSIGARLRAAEATEADYQAAVDLITTQALALVSANVAEEVEVQRDNVAAIRVTLEALLAEYEAVQTGGVPASGIAVSPIPGLAGTNVQVVLTSIEAALSALDFYTKSQSDSRYATPANVADAVSGLLAAAPGALDTLDELAAALGDDPNFAATILTALALRVRVDAAQAFTPAEKGRGRANIDAGILGGLRNRIINGNFDLWQRGTAIQTVASVNSFAFGPDRFWAQATGNGGANYQLGMPLQVFVPGQTAVPGEPSTFLRLDLLSMGTGATQTLVRLRHAIEDARTLAGKTATLTFYAKASIARNARVAFYRTFGSGGSATEFFAPNSPNIALTTAWQKFTMTVAIPTIAGKTFGAGSSTLDVNLIIAHLGDVFGGSDPNRPLGAIGSLAGGSIDIARMSLVEGDATMEADPFSPRHIQQELALCQRYYQAFGTTVVFKGAGLGANSVIDNLTLPVAMRVPPTVTFTPSLGTGHGASASISLLTMATFPDASGSRAYDFLKLDAEI